MPDSNLMKKALAQSLKELVRVHSFEKVGVNDICDACQVSRNTFYYHFQDKYALVEWIFNTEFIEVMKKSNVDDRWVVVDSLCQYLYRERDFYAKLMQFHGQNSFRQYFQDFLFAVVEKFVMPERTDIDTAAGQGSMSPETIQAFYARFIADAILFAIFRWLNDGAKQPPEDFIALLRNMDDLIHMQVNRRTREMNQDESEHQNSIV